MCGKSRLNVRLTDLDIEIYNKIDTLTFFGVYFVVTVWKRIFADCWTNWNFEFARTANDIW